MVWEWYQWHLPFRWVNWETCVHCPDSSWNPQTLLPISIAAKLWWQSTTALGMELPPHMLLRTGALFEECAFLLRHHNSGYNMVLPNTKTRYIPKTCKSEIFCAVKNNNSTTIHFLFLMFSDVARNDISPLLSHSKTNCTWGMSKIEEEQYWTLCSKFGEKQTVGNPSAMKVVSLTIVTGPSSRFGWQGFLPHITSNTFSIDNHVFSIICLQ